MIDRYNQYRKESKASDQYETVTEEIFLEEEILDVEEAETQPVD